MATARVVTRARASRPSDELTSAPLAVAATRWTCPAIDGSGGPLIDTPARILSRAEQRFAEQGYAGTSLSSIARAVDLGNAGLLHHYPSKEALYRAVLEDIAEDLGGRTDSALRAADGPVGQLRGLVAALVGLHRDRPTALMIITQEFLDRSGRIDTATVLPLAHVVADTITVIEAGQADGSIRGGDPVAITASLHGVLLHGMLGQRVYARTADRLPAEDWERQVIDSALASVLADGPAEG